jgi:4-amino-4-deoxy-L-arabinose transferase-like glycosyltransferase
MRPFLCLSALLLAFIYFYGLDGLHIPKNGDEYLFMNIARLTAASGKLLPLQSQIVQTRNTKPPLLFWQGIATTAWGNNWTLWNLRYPSAIYSILTAMLTLLVAKRLSGRIETGVAAALAFLAFYSTYRYGRPFLTDAGMIFWLQLPLFTLLYWRPGSFDSRIAVPLLCGIEIGIGLLYKSFALVVPICLAMSSWYLFHRGYCFRYFLAADLWKIALSALLALCIFGLWFLFDPNPSYVWKDFVLGENIAKFDPQNTSYLQKMLWGSSSVWALALLFPVNAGLLVFPMAALFLLAFVTRREATPEKTLLWLWVIVLFVVFSTPSHRSERYLMPAMPALSVLLVLDWEKISRKLFLVTLTCCGLLLAVSLYLALGLNRYFSVPLYGWPYWLLLAFTFGVILTGMLVPNSTRALSIVATLLVYLIFSAFMRPLDADGQLGSFSKEAQQELNGKQVWVPINWVASDEPYRFLLPGADVHSYDLDSKLNTKQLADRYSFFVKQVPITVNPARIVLSECPDCRIIGERLNLRSRHNNQEIRAMLLEGKLFDLLFARELLIASPGAPHGFAVPGQKTSVAVHNTR